MKEMSAEFDWASFWNDKAAHGTDFQATGRGSMDIAGFLYTVREISRVLDLRSDDRVLDIGCGTGIIALALSAITSSITAIDISKNSVARATENLCDVPGATAQEGSITRTGMEDGTFNKVLAYSVLQYLESTSAARAALREVARVLKLGGQALLAANPDPARRDNLVAEINKNTDDKARGLNLDLISKTLWLSQSEWISLAEAEGLNAECRPIHPRIWQHFYMFDLVVQKNG